MARTIKIFRHELKNVIRSKTILAGCILLFVLALSFIRISGDFNKAILGVFSVLSVGVPLYAMLFTAVYWYYNDRFTQLVLTMPLDRSQLFWSRWLALTLAIGGSLCLSLSAAFAIYSGVRLGLLFVLALILFLVAIFVTLGFLVANLLADRMKGIGVVLGLWLYTVLIHDGLILILLVVLKDFSLDRISAICAALNPIGLTRLLLLLHFDAPLLLSQTGALMRRLVTSWESYLVAGLIGFAWLALPLMLARRIFRKADF